MTRFAATTQPMAPRAPMRSAMHRQGTESDALVELFLVPPPAPRDEAPPVQVNPATPVVPTAASATRPASLLDCLPGLRSIQARCPYAPDVELGCDASGLIHAAAWIGRGAGPGAVAEVLTAAQWAREHATLLAHFTAGPARAEAVPHLFTDDPTGVRWLGGIDLRLHLVARAGPAWAQVEL